jgi:integrase
MNLANISERKTRKSVPSKSVGSLLAGGKSRIEWDEKVPNFGQRILASGERRWIVIKRPDGGIHPVTVTLGSCDVHSLKEARKWAHGVIAQLDKGNNPNVEKQKAREAERAKKAEAENTFFQMGRSYLRRCEEKNRSRTTVLEYQRILHGNDLEPWRVRPINGISHGEIESLIERVRSRAPVMANRMLAFVSAVFKHARFKGAIENDPLKSLNRDEIRHVEKSRNRTLVHPYTGDLSELLAVWRGAESIEPEHHPLRALAKLLILTGARAGVFTLDHPGQTEALTWRHVKDLNRPEHARLEIPPAIRKGGNRDNETRVIPLSPEAIKILNGLAKAGDNAPVFTVDGERPLMMTSKVRAIWQEQANKIAGRELEPWTPHDLRRSVATGLGHLGTPHAVIDEILDHAGEAKRGIRAVYDRSQRVAACREWLRKWAAHLSLNLAMKNPKNRPSRA